MNILRSAAHLRRESGDELFAALVSPDNTAAVRKFAESLVESALPTEITVGGRTYEILPFLKEGLISIYYPEIVGRAKKMKSSLGQEDCEFIFAHQDEIPASLQGKVAFVFTDWQSSRDSEVVAFLYCSNGRWSQCWSNINSHWYLGGRLLRRKQE